MLCRRVVRLVRHQNFGQRWGMAKPKHSRFGVGKCGEYKGIERIGLFRDHLMRYRAARTPVSGGASDRPTERSDVR